MTAIGQVALLIIAVIVGGGLIAAQGPIYSRLAGFLGGPLPATMCAFAVGAAALALLLILSGGSFPDRAMIAKTPLWIWSGALIGVYVVLVSILSIPRLGVAGYMVCVVLGQLSAACYFDQVGAFGIATRPATVTTFIGLCLVAVGAVLVIWRSS